MATPFDDFNNPDPETENNMHNLDWSQWDQSGRLQQKTYRFSINKAYTKKRDSKNGEVVVFVAECEILEPPEDAGRTHEETFFIGTSDDPYGLKLATWNAGRSFPAKNLAALCEVCGVIKQEPQNIAGKQFCATVIWNDSNGREYTNLSNYAPAGSVTPGTPLAPRTFTKQNSQQLSQMMASAEQECSICHKMFPQSTIADHMSGCVTANL